MCSWSRGAVRWPPVVRACVELGRLPQKVRTWRAIGSDVVCVCDVRRRQPREAIFCGREARVERRWWAAVQRELTRAACISPWALICACGLSVIIIGRERGVVCRPEPRGTCKSHPPCSHRLTPGREIVIASKLAWDSTFTCAHWH